MLDMPLGTVRSRIHRGRGRLRGRLGGSSMTEVESEEAWEADIGAMLGALPVVDPPEGFIAAALDHRPLGAIRTLAALLVGVVVAVGASLVVGAGGGRIIPEIDDLSQRHLTAAAGSRRRRCRVGLRHRPWSTGLDRRGFGTAGRPGFRAVGRWIDTSDVRQACRRRRRPRSAVEVRGAWRTGLEPPGAGVGSEGSRRHRRLGARIDDLAAVTIAAAAELGSLPDRRLVIG